jgi:2-dehydro-3-deoxyglucarate aldolase/4-hydroxy-2-oxoheptanedioate aldolase
MRSNPIRQAINRGDVQFGTWINMVRNPAILTLLKSAGLDFARVDMEHSSPDMETVANMALLARALDFPIVVRPPEANREWITRLLDGGVWNLHCPQVDTAKQAEAIVQASRYAPWGTRGMYNEGPATDFEPGVSEADKIKFANENVFVTVMLETKGAFEQLDEIAAMPGIDAVTLGPTDLSQDLGVYATPEAGPVLDEHRYRIIEATKRYGKTAAMLVSSVEQARKWRDAGVLLLGYSSEVSVLSEGYRTALAAMKD